MDFIQIVSKHIKNETILLVKWLMLESLIIVWKMELKRFIRKTFTVRFY